MELRAEYKKTEVGVIPEAWDVHPLGAFGKFKGGNGFPLRYQGHAFGDYPFFKVSDMNNDGNSLFMQNSNHWITEKVRKEMAATAYPSGSIVFAKIGAAIFLERKKILVRESCIDNNVMAFVFNSQETDWRFFHYIFLTIELGKLVSATALPSLNGRDIAALTFGFPKAPEQRAIATALSDADTLIASLDALIAKKRDLKQATMQQLLTGKTRLPGFTGDWEIKRLGEVGRALIGLTYRPSDIRSSGTLVLRSSNIQNGTLSFDNNVFVVPEAALGSIVEVGDLLICARNGSRDLIGKSVRLDERTCGMAFGAFMAAYRSEFNDFLSFQFQSDLIKRQINEHLGATINQITNKSLLSFQVPMPSDRSEQVAITEVLTDMSAELVSLEVKRDKAHALKQGMMQELLTGRIRLV